MKSTELEINVGVLILNGFERNDAASLAPALQEELTQLFARNGAPASQSVQLEALDAGTVSPSDPIPLGRRLALAIHDGLRGRPAAPTPTASSASKTNPSSSLQISAGKAKQRA